MASHAEVLIRHEGVSPTATASVSMVVPRRTARIVAVRDLPFAVRCVAGCVWVTLEGEQADHVLYPGEHFTASALGDVMVYGFEPSEVVFSHSRRTAP